MFSQHQMHTRVDHVPHAFCVAWKVNQGSYTHPKDWQDKAVFTMLKSLEQSKELQADSCICRLCRHELSLCCKNDNHTPKRMKESQGKQSCFVRSCNEGADIVTKVANQKTVCECFNMLPSVESVSTATALCSTHYQELYRHIHPTSYVHT